MDEIVGAKWRHDISVFDVGVAALQDHHLDSVSIFFNRADANVQSHDLRDKIAKPGFSKRQPKKRDRYLPLSE